MGPGFPTKRLSIYYAIRLERKTLKKKKKKKKRRILGFPVSVSIIFMGSLISASASECPLFSFIFSASISAHLDERAATQKAKRPKTSKLHAT